MGKQKAGDEGEHVTWTDKISSTRFTYEGDILEWDSEATGSKIPLSLVQVDLMVEENGRAEKQRAGGQKGAGQMDTEGF